MAKFLTASKLGILPEERKALIAFIKSPALGRTVSVNGHAHFYAQGYVNDEGTAEDNECGTAGCVAGFVFAHAKHVQGKSRLRGARSPGGYIDNACAEKLFDDEDGGVSIPKVPVLSDLYRESYDYKLTDARKVVAKFLTSGKVVWP